MHRTASLWLGALSAVLTLQCGRSSERPRRHSQGDDAKEAQSGDSESSPIIGERERVRLTELQRLLGQPSTVVAVRNKKRGQGGSVVGLELSPDPDMPDRAVVLSPDGVVGTLQRRDGKEEVVLVTSASSGVDVVNQRTRGRAFVRGAGDAGTNRCVVEYVSRTDALEVGDLMETSGVGLRFPKALPVCRVSKVEKTDAGVYRHAECVATADFAALGGVVVVASPISEPAGAPTASGSGSVGRP